MNNFDRMNTIRRDKETKLLRKCILKYLKDIPTVGERHRGVFSITGYRFYDTSLNTYYVEVDVVFKGELKVSVSSIAEDKWVGADVKTNGNYRISPIRLGQFLRNTMFRDINQRLSLFDTKISNQYGIKKMKWV